MNLPQTIAVITRGGLGDLVCYTPSFRAIKAQYPHFKLHVFAVRDYMEVFRGNPFIDHLEAQGPMLDINKYESLYAFHYANFKPGQNKLGPAVNVIAEAFNLNLKISTGPELFLSESECAMGREALKAFDRPITIAPHSKIHNKFWDMAHWQKVVDDNPQFTFIQLGSKEEPLLERVQDFRTIAVRQSLRILSAAHAHVGLDSFFQHAATALGIPAVVLFGASTPNEWGYAANTNLYKPTPCSPCTEKPNYSCEFGRKCIEAITVSEVSDALTGLFA